MLYLDLKKLFRGNIRVCGYDNSPVFDIEDFPTGEKTKGYYNTGQQIEITGKQIKNELLEKGEFSCLFRSI